LQEVVRLADPTSHLAPSKEKSALIM